MSWTAAYTVNYCNDGEPRLARIGREAAGGLIAWTSLSRPRSISGGRARLKILLRTQRQMRGREAVGAQLQREFALFVAAVDGPVPIPARTRKSVPFETLNDCPLVMNREAAVIHPQALQDCGVFIANDKQGKVKYITIS